MNTNNRPHLFKQLSIALVKHGRIQTTFHKARKLSSVIEIMITIAKVNNLNTRRALLSKLYNDKESTDILLERIGPSSINRKGGYTRILKIDTQRTDAADMAVIEFVDFNLMNYKK